MKRKEKKMKTYEETIKEIFRHYYINKGNDKSRAIAETISLIYDKPLMQVYKDFRNIPFE